MIAATKTESKLEVNVLLETRSLRVEEFEESWWFLRTVVAAVCSHAPQQPCAEVTRAVQLLKKCLFTLVLITGLCF